MNRVEIVNLGGRARHIERDGAAAIDAWLETARRRLNGDPDRDDLLLDFEQAIVEKCDAYLTDGRDVVTTEEVAAVLESLGTIEPSDETAEGEPAPPPPPAEEHPRRLYRLPGDRVIAGVCSGVAAWLRVDVTVVRVAWVILPLLLAGLTDGASLPLSVGLYALLAFVLPAANSPEARAAAYGFGATAQDRLMQARSGAMPALTTLGTALAAVIGLMLRLMRIALLVAITAVLAAWVVGAAWLAIAGDPWLTAFGPGFSSWLVPLFLTAIAVILVAPLTASFAIVDYLTRGGDVPGRGGRVTVWLLSSTAGLVAAVMVAVLIVTAIPGMRDLMASGNARIYFRGTTYCYVSGTSDAHCQPGDEIRREEQRRPPPVPRVPTVPPVPTVPVVPGTPAVPVPGTLVPGSMLPGLMMPGTLLPDMPAGQFVPTAHGTFFIPGGSSEFGLPAEAR